MSSPMARHSIAAPRLQIGGILILDLATGLGLFYYSPKKIEVHMAPNRELYITSIPVILPLNPSNYNRMSKTLLVTEPEFRAIPLTQTAKCKTFQSSLDAYASEIHKYHPDGKGIGDRPDCPCCMCDRVKLDVTDYLIKASELTDKILRNMTYCDQQNLQNVLCGLDRKSCLDPYNGEMESIDECDGCHEFYNEFLGTFMYGSREQMRIINDLLHGRPVTGICCAEDVKHTDTAGILIQILYRGAPEFVEHLRSLIYDDQDMPCACNGCSYDNEENDLVLAIQRSL